MAIFSGRHFRLVGPARTSHPETPPISPGPSGEGSLSQMGAFFRQAARRQNRRCWATPRKCHDSQTTPNLATRSVPTLIAFPPFISSVVAGGRPYPFSSAVRLAGGPRLCDMCHIALFFVVAWQEILFRRPVCAQARNTHSRTHAHTTTTTTTPPTLAKNATVAPVPQNGPGDATRSRPAFPEGRN